MRNFTYCLPTKFVFGRGAENKVGEELKNFGAKKVLIHFGGSSAVKSGLIDRVEANLRAAGMETVRLGGVMPNPRDTKVYDGIELALPVKHYDNTIVCYSYSKSGELYRN